MNGTNPALFSPLDHRHLEESCMRIVAVTGSLCGWPLREGRPPASGDKASALVDWIRHHTLRPARGRRFIRQYYTLEKEEGGRLVPV